jgi:class 3 adenylate cyclase/tetratricopeptide (TPR) repeat protein
VSVTTERKLVTVVFCDLVGSTALGERLDAEALQSVQHAYFDRMRAVVEQFGGTVEKFAGDAVVAVFGVPTLHEDDAERAVRCALEMHQALLGLADTLRPRFGVELDVRIGVQTGEAVVSGGADALATGDVMNTAARLEQKAAPGEILVGRETMLLTSGVVEYGDEMPVQAKGKRERVRAWPALRLRPRRKRAGSPLVGRERELELLAATLEHAIAQREQQAVLVLGEPGIGKTRLAEEFADRASGRAAVFRGACLPYGEGSTWRPFEEVLRREAGIGEADDDEQALGKLRRALGARHAPDELRLVVAQLAPLIAAAGAAVTSEHELRWGLCRYLEGLASSKPVVMVLDDLHWADDALLEAIHELLQTISAVPLMVVLQGRPELRQRTTELLSDEKATVISLGALSQRKSSALVDNLAAAVGTTWAEDVRDAIVERGEGSPLFLEEIAAMAHEEGLDAGVPRSLRALIAARLDLLPPETKRVAQAAAVVGDVFWDGAVADLAGVDVDLVAPALRRLATRGFVDEEAESSFRGQRQVSFHHALIREVTYASVPKIERSELHRRAAAWLGRHTEHRPELIVATAHHFEQALSLRREVYPAEPAMPKLVEAAVDALRSAASWTGANASVLQSIELLRRAVSVAESNRKLTQLASAQLAAMLARSGGSAEAVELAEAVLAGAEPSEATALASLALAEEARSRADAAAMTKAGTRALELARSLRLPSVEVEALDIVGLAETWSGRLAAAVERRRRATEIALELRDLPRAAWSMAGYSAIALLGLGKLDDAERQATEAMRLARETGSLRALESAHTVFGFLRRAQDRLEEAIAHGRERFGFAEKLGERLWLFNSLTVSLARPLIDLGRLEEAWECLDRALEISRERGGAFESAARAQRVAILLARGQLDEAAEEAELLDSIGEPYPEVADLRAAQGRNEEADEIWRCVLETFAASEDRLDHAETVVRYARFLAGRGRSDEARARLAEARDLVEGAGAKFHERLIREAEALLS